MLAVTPQRSEDLNLPDLKTKQNNPTMILDRNLGSYKQQPYNTEQNIKGTECATYEGKLYQVLHEIFRMTPGFSLNEENQRDTPLLLVLRSVCVTVHSHTCKHTH